MAAIVGQTNDAPGNELTQAIMQLHGQHFKMFRGQDGWTRWSIGHVPGRQLTTCTPHWPRLRAPEDYRLKGLTVNASDAVCLLEQTHPTTDHQGVLENLLPQLGRKHRALECTQDAIRIRAQLDHIPKCLRLPESADGLLYIGSVDRGSIFPRGIDCTCRLATAASSRNQILRII
jgi:hypothetical protein